MKRVAIPNFLRINLGQYTDFDTVQNISKANDLVKLSQYQQALDVLSHIINSNNEQAGAIARLYSGFIYIALRDSKKGYDLWRDGINDKAPLAQLFHETRLAVKEFPQSKACFVFMQMLVNYIANDQYCRQLCGEIVNRASSDTAKLSQSLPDTRD